MKTLTILIIFISAAFSNVRSQGLPPHSKKIECIAHNRKIETVEENNKSILKLSEGPGAGIAWLKDYEFSEGTIEFDVKGRNILQKSFVGIAFHGDDNETYESIYFRPFNFQSSDPVRKIHAVQYAFEPLYGFQQLRKTQKDKYESAISPPDILPTQWFHVKIDVRGNRIKVFVNGFNEPCMDVTTLNPNPTGKKIGFWVGNNSNGEFAGFSISK